MSPVSMTPGCSGFSKYEINSSWLVIWFDALESIYHTSFVFKMLFFIELVLCFITKDGPDRFLAPLEPSAECDL